MKSWKSTVMFSFVYMLLEGLYVTYTFASAVVRLEVGLVGAAVLTGSVGLAGLGGGPAEPTGEVVVAGLPGVTVVMVVVMTGLVATWVTGLAAVA